MNITLKRVTQELTFNKLMIGDVFTQAGCENLYVKVHHAGSTPPVEHPVRNAVSINGNKGVHFCLSEPVIKATSIVVEV